MAGRAAALSAAAAARHRALESCRGRRPGRHRGGRYYRRQLRLCLGLAGAAGRLPRGSCRGGGRARLPASARGQTTRTRPQSAAARPHSSSSHSSFSGPRRAEFLRCLVTLRPPGGLRVARSQCQWASAADGPPGPRPGPDRVRPTEQCIGQSRSRGCQ